MSNPTYDSLWESGDDWWAALDDQISDAGNATPGFGGLTPDTAVDLSYNTFPNSMDSNLNVQSNSDCDDKGLKLSAGAPVSSTNSIPVEETPVDSSERKVLKSEDRFLNKERLLVDSPTLNFPANSPDSSSNVNASDQIQRQP